MEKYAKPMADVINVEMTAIMAASEPGIESGAADPTQTPLGKELFDDDDDDDF